MNFCAKHKINLFRTDDRFFAMQKKCYLCLKIIMKLL